VSAVLEVRDLHTVLDTDAGLARAVEAVSLTIERGETFALVGESGCGKSMTALSLLRLLPDNGRVTQGAVTLGAVDLTQLPESQMRDQRGRRIGIIFQEPATSLNPLLRVGDQIAEVIERHAPIRGAAARARAIDWLRRVGLPEPERRIDSYPFQMSGGQKQRVMIAIALAAEPDVLIADEPTTALDVTIQKQILDLLAELQRTQGMALLLITHDLAIVSQMAHRVALMYAGQIVEVAPRERFFGRALHPYAQLLFDALPDRAHRDRPLAAIGGTVPALTQVFAGCRFVERCPRAFEACRSTPPELLAQADGHSVRCLLYSHRAAAAPVFEEKREPAPSQRTASPSSAALGTALLSIRDYKVHFPIRAGLLKRVVGYMKAVDGVSFSLHSGKTLALVGESGCGKTTIGKAVLQLLRGLAHIEGSAHLDGVALDQLQGEALRAARRKAQIIFQDPFASLNPRMRVAEILEEGVAALRPDVDASSRKARIAALIDRVGLRRDALGRYPHEFSGGQRQRLAIARALAVEPQLIVCDEPTSALDVSVQAQILNLLAELQRDLGLAYLFITHNFGVVEYLAHQIAVMREGLIVESGLAEDVLTRPQHEYTRTLLAAVPRLAAV
jgi:peptide/nickel transport system ATP-binding protein